MFQVDGTQSLTALDSSAGKPYWAQKLSKYDTEAHLCKAAALTFPFYLGLSKREYA